MAARMSTYAGAVGARYLTPPVLALEFDAAAGAPEVLRLEIGDGRILRRIPTNAAPEMVVTPGLINCHVHWLMVSGTSFVSLLEALSERPEEIHQTAFENGRKTLRVGITTACDKGAPTGGNLPFHQLWREAWERGEPLPRGPFSPMMLVRPESFAGAWCVRVDNEHDIEARALECARGGARLLKIIPEADWQNTSPHYPLTFTPAAVMRAGEVARANGLSLCVHAKGRESIALAVSAGAECIEHGLEASAADLLQMEEKGVYYCPTLEGFACRLAWSRRYGQRQQMAEAEWALANEVVRSSLDLGSGRRYSHLLFGSDAGSFDTPHASLDELFHLRAAGVPAWQVFKAATVNGAAYLNQAGCLGSLRVGAHADLIYWRTNPLELDLQSWQSLASHIEGVVSRGVEVERG